ncbi:MULTISPECIES: DUF3300 domain-containing protein [Halocynthiibacter]|uniref:DUF3300 domain-containing protein n=1 Tax=Halocynthiibacter halioticoli TaxID=2986804 RepID=A0AAE3IXY1_9RHOB|nr:MULTISPECIES: DUF3300 domain-containing protein [Halocynthiibacter]MCV6822953.1 DUF3300 domain-containing protein [Halocynthiibacter halioticoli]MCW4055954.1 DUF3300 domain-containing protein [Halocynthiibacter sp. SDUM655004]
MFRCIVIAIGISASTALLAQETSDTTVEADSAAGTDASLLTDAELQTLVAPVALYPDTLLIQIFVAATQPLEVVKAERFLLDNADRDPAELEPEIDEMGWDPSVAVLATAFPEVVGQMATHIDWTETVGTAMMAQSDDVLDAVQVMRDQAIDSGALVTGPEQTVEVTEDDDVVITPTEPETVYVPQYDPATVYTGPSTGDVIGTALLTFGTFALIDEIFDDDDDWNDYWGCRNCGGWGGNPIIRDPDIDIDVDGNVNIGNNIDLGDRTDIGWKPDPDRQQAARDKIADHKKPETGRGELPINRPEGRTDELRDKLSRETGAKDISRDRTKAAVAGAGAVAGGAALANRGNGDKSLPKVDRGNIDPNKAAAKKQVVDRTKRPDATKKPVAKKPQTAKKPQVKKAATAKKKASAAKGQAMKKKTSGAKAHKASKRGHAAKAKRR